MWSIFYIILFLASTPFNVVSGKMAAEEGMDVGEQQKPNKIIVNKKKSDIFTIEGNRHNIFEHFCHEQFGWFVSFAFEMTLNTAFVEDHMPVHMLFVRRDKYYPYLQNTRVSKYDQSGLKLCITHKSLANHTGPLWKWSV